MIVLYFTLLGLSVTRKHRSVW